MDEADLRKKTEKNVFAEFLSKVMPKGQAALPPPPTPQKMRRGTRTAVTVALPQPQPHHRLKSTHMILRNKNVSRMMMTKIITMTMIISLRTRPASMVGKMSGP